MSKIIRAQDAKHKSVGDMEIAEYLQDASISGDTIEINGRHGTMKFSHGSRIYFVVKGAGAFTIDDVESEIALHDVIYIESGTVYDFSGSMTLFLVCSPAFDPAHDVMLDT